MKRKHHEQSRFSLSYDGGPRYLQIVDSEDVLIVEDSLERIRAYKRWLPRARLSASARDAIAEIEKKTPDTIFLDRDFVLSYGEDVAKYLAATKFKGKVYVTSANPFGAQLIVKILVDGGIDCEVTPFSILGIIHTPARSS